MRRPLLLLGILLIVACEGPPPVRYARAPTDCDTRTTPGHFDRECTARAVGLVNLSDCAKDTSGGSGHLRIQLLPSGGVGNAHVDSPNFAGTATARCIEERFSRIHIPPFEGAPVTIGKSFTLP